MTGYQLFSIMVLFQLGTTVIFGFEAGAGRDAWITAAGSALLGSVLIAGYAGITRLTGYVSLVQWFRRGFGPWLGVPLAWLYPLLFIYDAARILTDLEFLVPLTLLPATPPWFFLPAILAVALYLMFSGVEVLGRIAGVLLPLLVVFSLLEAVLLIASKSVHTEYFLPILGEGWGRVFAGIWPLGITQTYGESIEMAVFWHLLNKKGRLPAVGIAATLSAGMIIVLFDALGIAAMGEHLFMEMIFPTFTILNLSSVAGFLENLNALGAMYFLCTSFVKMAVHLIAAALCIQELTAAANSGAAVWLSAGSAFFVSLTMADNFSEHLKAGLEQLPHVLWVPMFLVLPAAAGAAVWFGMRFRKAAYR
ncbi:endospore germination permease [Paenibacillus sp.]|uniref:GerAB/ArcD/ProY family transporter n=1 Tax=Paenibacillus sp. TaxID=58172 RepID=UPI00281163EF|nr:endospore germination permease [Paenibacillus sp.]